MQWSKLRSRVRALVCPELKDRIDFHVTRYREATDDGTEAWITFDGDKIFGAGYYHHFVPMCIEWHRREALGAVLDAGVFGEIDQVLGGKEIHSTRHLVGAMRAYLDTPVRDALRSENPFLKALAIIDRRVGRRTLAKLEIDESEHSLVREIHRLRLAATRI